MRHHFSQAAASLSTHHAGLHASTYSTRFKGHGAVSASDRLKDAEGEKLRPLVASRFARGDGGFGGPSEGQPEPTQGAGSRPDRSATSRRAGSGAGVSLCGDRNPLQSDPRICQKTKKAVSQNRF